MLDRQEINQELMLVEHETFLNVDEVIQTCNLLNFITSSSTKIHLQQIQEQLYCDA